MSAPQSESQPKSDRDASPSVLPFTRVRSRARLRGSSPSMKGASARWESSALPFTTLLARLTPYIEARSARLARQDRELQQDLQQEGRIALWRLDPARIEAAACADAYCRASIRFAMSRYLQRSARHVPGDHRISWGRVEAVLESYGRRAA